MKVLMLGWEFPPFISGGLGTACYGLTRAMSGLGTEIVFVLPRPVDSEHSTHVKMASPSSAGFPAGLPGECGEFRVPGLPGMAFRTIPSVLQPYQTSEGYQQHIRTVSHAGFEFTVACDADGNPISVPSMGGGGHYGSDLYQEVHRYAALATIISQQEEFDVVHAHDWMTYPAGVAVAAATNKPLVVHIHSTEFDRSGENVNQQVYDIERQGLHCADRVIAVSGLTRDIVTSRYSVPFDKVRVVHNAIEMNEEECETPRPSIKRNEKTVLFLGRITMQKGPEYFLAAAKLVLEVMDNVRFVVAGSGDMERRMIEMAANLGIGHRVLFTGFLRGQAVDRMFRMADLFVMPSVSEPFGLVPLEALRNDVPVIISNQSGVSEILTHALKVDFWDTKEMANKIVSVLRHPPLHTTLCEHGNHEVRSMSWRDAARECVDVYESLMAVPA